MSLIRGNHGGLGGAGAPGGALGSFFSETIDQSLRLNAEDSAHLTFTQGTATDISKWTVNFWLKRTNALSASDDYDTVFGVDGPGNTAFTFLNGQIYLFVNYNTSGSQARLITNRVFRDPSAWYNFHVTFDRANGTAAQRLRLYVNGVEETSFATDERSNITSSSSSGWNVSGLTVAINRRSGGVDSRYHSGYLAQFYNIDGAVVAPTEFAETKDGVWIPKAYSGSYGNNGWLLNFAHDTESEGFTPVLYEGTRVADTIVKGVGFTPDLVWVKRRDDVQEGSITDSVRGLSSQLRPAVSNVESTFSNAVTSFDADGFTLGVDTSSGTQSYNYYQDSHVAWCWEAGGAPTATNSAGAGATPTSGSVKIDGSNLGSALAGTIPATKLTANTSKGFSIVSYTGTGSNGTIAHGLSSAPEMIIIKATTRSENWLVYHKSDGGTDGRSFLNLNTTGAKFDNGPGSYFQDTPPTSSVFYQNNSSYNQNTYPYIAYCWHSVSGYSKFGSYTGSGSSGKAVTGLGFRPVFVMIKRTDSSGGWHVFDSVRFPSNPIDKRLEWDNAEAENSAATVDIDFDSDGFTLKTSFDNMNASSGEYIFMAFADTRDSAFYKDASGNLNNFTPNNVFTHDVVLDSPTNNFATMNPIYHTVLQAALLDGDLRVDTGGFNGNANNYGAVSTFAIPKDKKIYIEVECTDATGANWYAGFATQSGLEAGTSSTNVGGASAVTFYNRAVMKNGTQFQYSSSSGVGGLGGGTSPLAAGDVLGMAVDGSNGNVWLHKNGSYFKTIASNNGSTGNTGDPSANSDPVATIDNVPAEDLFVVIGGNTSASAIFVNFGQDSQNVASANSDSEGIGTFEYAVPTGYVCLCSSNLTTPAIGPSESSQATDHFDTLLYTGDGNAGLEVNGLNFQPDFLWIKRRDSSQNFSNALLNSVTGATKGLYSNRTNSEFTSSGTNDLQSFDNDGFTIGPSNQFSGNDSGGTFVAWSWKAGGAPSADNSAGNGATPTANSVKIDGSNLGSALAGSLAATRLSANTTAGFSIVIWDASGVSSGTVAHGLTVAPDIIIAKPRDFNGTNWFVQVPDILANTNMFNLETTGASYNPGYNHFNDTVPTDEVFSFGGYMGGHSDGGGNDLKIAYCFHSVEGFSKVGSYIGNNSTDGPFVFTGFRPAFLLLKRKDSAASWLIYDDKRDTYNQMQYALFPNAANGEYTSNLLHVDFLSNGFKIRNATYGETNASGGSYIYLAFAEAPFKFSNAR